MEGDNDMQDDDPSEDRVRRSGGANNGEDMNDEPELNGYQRWVVVPFVSCLHINLPVPFQKRNQNSIHTHNHTIILLQN
jgi:hypothetical protein